MGFPFVLSTWTNTKHTAAAAAAALIPMVCSRRYGGDSMVAAKDEGDEEIRVDLTKGKALHPVRRTKPRARTRSVSSRQQLRQMAVKRL